jgi:hypothetical protein
MLNMCIQMEHTITDKMSKLRDFLRASIETAFLSAGRFFVNVRLLFWHRARDRGWRDVAL